MKPETGPALSPQEKAEHNKKRILSDAELIKEGADVTAEGQVVVIEGQIKDAKVEMGDHFYKKSEELKKKNEELEDTLRVEKNKGLKWWEKEYKGYNIIAKNRLDFLKIEEYIETLSESEIRRIRSLGKGKRAEWFFRNTTKMEQDVIYYFHVKEQLEEYLAKGGE